MPGTRDPGKGAGAGSSTRGPPERVWGPHLHGLLYHAQKGQEDPKPLTKATSVLCGPTPADGGVWPGVQGRVPATHSAPEAGREAGRVTVRVGGALGRLGALSHLCATGPSGVW